MKEKKIPIRVKIEWIKFTLAVDINFFYFSKSHLHKKQSTRKYYKEILCQISKNSNRMIFFGQGSDREAQYCFQNDLKKPFVVAILDFFLTFSR